MHYIRAEAYVAHDLAKTFEELEIIYEQEESYLSGRGATSGPFLKLHKDPRFRAIVKKMSLHWPDL
jgi:hypothetical protein